MAWWSSLGATRRGSDSGWSSAQCWLGLHQQSLGAVSSEWCLNLRTKCSCLKTSSKPKSRFCFPGRAGAPRVCVESAMGHGLQWGCEEVSCVSLVSPQPWGCTYQLQTCWSGTEEVCSELSVGLAPLEWPCWAPRCAPVENTCKHNAVSSPESKPSFLWLCAWYFVGTEEDSVLVGCLSERLGAADGQPGWMQDGWAAAVTTEVKLAVLFPYTSLSFSFLLPSWVGLHISCLLHMVSPHNFQQCLYQAACPVPACESQQAALSEAAGPLIPLLSAGLQGRPRRHHIWAPQH